MSGASIQTEVDTALKSLASELGSGLFPITLLREVNADDTPWERTARGDQIAAPTEFSLAGNVEMYPRSMIDGTLIQSEDRRMMVSAKGERPTTADRLRIGETEYRIILIEEFAPQGVPLFYLVQARV